jgi:hypothetical protein
VTWRVQHAAACDADIVVLRIEHRINARRRRRRNTRTRNWQYAAVSRAASGGIARRVRTDDDDHQRH